tara:strand:- start:173 stop:724 length:552 start_codon:yes stop_codon:yes gene_type:complete
MNTKENTKKKTTLDNLPSDMIGVICEYLNIKDRNILLGVSKTLKIEHKKFRYLKLKKWHSLEFYRNENFRKTINNLVVYPHRQLSLNLGMFKPFIVDESVLGNVHTLNLSGCRSIVDVSALGNVHTLNLQGSQYIDVSALGNVNTLNLSHSFHPRGVSALKNVHKLNLDRCKGIYEDTVWARK